MKDGFYTALGTPIDANGSFAPAGFVSQIEQQIATGASGLLVMGSMGAQPCIRDKDFRAVAQSAVEANQGRSTLFVGAMDNSTSRVLDRISSLKGLAIDGVVITAPYYFVLSHVELLNFFRTIADKSPVPIYLYDLPTVTKHKISIDLTFELAQHKNIAGIKTADLALCRFVKNDPRTAGRFHMFFSGLDLLDAAHSYGLKMGLDGMFAMMPRTIADFYKSSFANDLPAAAKHLDLILNTRTFLAKFGIWRGFSYCMNLRGCKGNFMPDYALPLNESEQAQVKDYLRTNGLD
ncbi:MAG: dihydrodipicolinate synthase family protein [Opitutaceae bacterium]|nr:dihydrodipicolinate synthase family protein [Opitutaceae bacterium]